MDSNGFTNYDEYLSVHKLSELNELNEYNGYIPGEGGS